MAEQPTRGQRELLPRGAGAPVRPAPAPAAPKDTRLRTLDTPLPGGRVLRLMLSFDRDGAPEDLAILATAGRPTPRDMAEAVCLPASCLPALRDALASLTALG